MDRAAKMTDNIGYAFNERVDIEPEQAWEVYRDLPEPNAKECARILQQRGIKVSYDTIARWARRGEWRKRVGQLRAVTGVGNPKDVAAALKLQADELTPELLQGLQVCMIVRMAEQIETLPLKTADDFSKMVDVLDKFDAIIHRHRGAAIGAKGEARSPISLESFRAYQQDKKGSDPTSA
jgi:hypothetical protein